MTRKSNKSKSVAVVSNEINLSAPFAGAHYVDTQALAVLPSINHLLIADTASDVDDVTDAVLAEIDALEFESDTVDIRTQALAFDDVAVSTCIEAIEHSFDRRDYFEIARGNDVDGSNSYTKARAKMLKSKVAVARMFLAFNIEPSSVIERQISVSNMFSAKALDKVTEIARFLVGTGDETKMQFATSCFIACALAFSKDEAVSNRLNKKFLSSNDVSQLVSDPDLAAYIRVNQHKTITGGQDTQSSQVRNVLDVLGLGRVVDVEHSRGGFAINATHAFFDYFRSKSFIKTA